MLSLTVNHLLYNSRATQYTKWTARERDQQTLMLTPRNLVNALPLNMASRFVHSQQETLNSISYHTNLILSSPWHLIFVILLSLNASTRLNRSHHMQRRPLSLHPTYLSHAPTHTTFGSPLPVSRLHDELPSQWPGCNRKAHLRCLY